MRVITFNIKSANVPGRMGHATQERSWNLLAAYGADIALTRKLKPEPSRIGRASAGLLWGENQVSLATIQLFGDP